MGAVVDSTGNTFLLRPGQEQLRPSEAARHAAILNALPAHIALLDMQGTIVSVNEAWRQFASDNGLDGAACGTGANYLRICDEVRGGQAAQARQVADGIRSVLSRTTTSFAIEYSCHSPCEQRWFQLTVMPLSDDHLSGAVVMHANITERMLTQAAFLQTEAGLRRAQRMAGLAHVISRHDGAFESWSESLPQLLGFAPEGLPKSTREWLAIVHPDDRALVRAKAVEAAETNLRVDLEYRVRGPGGRDIHVRQSMEPLGVQGGNRTDGAYWFNTMQDVTAEWTTKQNLLVSELRFRQMAESIDAVFFLQNLDGSHVHYVSPAYERIWGRTCESLYAHPGSWIDSVHPDDLSRTLTARDAASRDQEFRIIHADGDVRWIHVRAFPIPDHNGVPYRIAGVASDITGRKRVEEALRAGEREQRQLAQALEVERSKLVAAQRVAKVGSWETDLATLSVAWSDEAHHIHGTSPQSFRPTHAEFLQLVHPDDRRAVDEAFRCSLDQHEACSIEHRLLLPGGEVKFVEERWQMVFDSAGNAVRAVGTCQDITEHKATDEKIRRLNRVYAVLSGVNTLIVRVRDRDELFREACRIATDEGGFRMALISIRDRATMKVVPVASAGKDEALIHAIRERLASAEAPTTMIARAMREQRPVIANDSQRDPQLVFGRSYAEADVRSVAVLPLVVGGEAVGVLALYSSEVDFFHDDELKLLVELANDVAFAIDHLDKQERLDYLAYYDVLTGLANRTLFLSRVAQYMRSAVTGNHQLALCVIDLERFKNINDTLGHAAGDALLRQVAELLATSVGDRSLVARMGADHFALVLPEITQAEEVARLLEKSMQVLDEHPFQLNGSVFRIAAKAGIALFPIDGDNADALYNRAEAALKKAKRGGDRYLFYTQTMTETVAGRLTLENQLRQALDREEFVLHYQPKVDLETGKVIGAEALIRWNDPRTGLVPPGRFIPVLEETGLIHEVGRWALRKAIEDYLRWHATGLAAVRIAVNVSSLQLRSQNFISQIEQVVGIHPLAAAGLELEITESMIMGDMAQSATVLRAIQSMGMTIAIDDFGTGFSSLAYLSKLPVDSLKIDRSFVTEMTASQEGLALVSTIITLAHSLKLKVVAEGVETEEQSRLLRLLRCDEVQGFLFGEAQPAASFERLFLRPVPSDEMPTGSRGPARA